MAKNPPKPFPHYSRTIPAIPAEPLFFCIFAVFFVFFKFSFFTFSVFFTVFRFCTFSCFPLFFPHCCTFCTFSCFFTFSGSRCTQQALHLCTSAPGCECRLCASAPLHLVLSAGSAPMHRPRPRPRPRGRGRGRATGDSERAQYRLCASAPHLVLSAGSGGQGGLLRRHRQATLSMARMKLLALSFLSAGMPSEASGFVPSAVDPQGGGRFGLILWRQACRLFCVLGRPKC